MALTLKIVNQFFCMTHHLMIIHYHAKFSFKKMVEWFRRYQADITGHMDRTTDSWTDGGSDSNIHPLPPPPPIFIQEGGGGVIEKKNL